MQGEKSVKTIINQLRNIEKHQNIFDAVTIIRGGGGEVGLSSYDDYELAKNIAMYPIPVLTGIGHSSNDTVAEMVSFQSFITPTKIAEFLIQKYHNFSVPLKDNIKSIENVVKNMLQQKSNNIKETARLFSSLTTNFLLNQKNILQNNSKSIVSNVSLFIVKQKNILKETMVFLKTANEKLCSKEKTVFEDINKYLSMYFKNKMEKENSNLLNIESKIKILSPLNILQRGFSITRVNGKRVKSIHQLKKGVEITTQLADGVIISEVKK